MASKNLWGQLPAADNIRLPVVVLREQASVLTRLTQGVLEGSVLTSRDGDEFELELRIVAPALDNYQYTVLRVFHGVHLYPVRVAPPDTLRRDWIRCDSEESFEEILAHQLSSNRVKKVIASLLAQSRAENE